MLLLLLIYVVLRALWKIDVHQISTLVNKSIYYYYYYFYLYYYKSIYHYYTSNMLSHTYGHLKTYTIIDGYELFNVTHLYFSKIVTLPNSIKVNANY